MPEPKPPPGFALDAPRPPPGFRLDVPAPLGRAPDVTVPLPPELTLPETDFGLGGGVPQNSGSDEAQRDFLSAMGRSWIERGRALQQPSAGSRVLSETARGVAEPFQRGNWGVPPNDPYVGRDVLGPLGYGMLHSLATGAEALALRPIEGLIRGAARGLGQLGQETGLANLGQPERTSENKQRLAADVEDLLNQALIAPIFAPHGVPRPVEAPRPELRVPERVPETPATPTVTPIARPVAPAAPPSIPELARPSTIPEPGPMERAVLNPPPGFTLDRLAQDGWKAEIDLQGAAPTIYAEHTRHVNVTAPDGRSFSIPVDVREGNLPNGDVASVSGIRNYAIREAQRRLGEGYVPPALDFPPWLPEAERARLTAERESETARYAQGLPRPPEPPPELPPRPAAPPVPSATELRPPEAPRVEPITPLPEIPGAPASRLGPAARSVERLAPDTSPTFTPAGRRVDVGYEVVDLSKLIASHDEGLRPNPRYPAELQPRARERAASQAQIDEIAARLEPRRLGRSSDATTGAPIVGPDGIVESGNGRVLALRRAYERHPERAQSYREFLESQGFDTTGIARPVLIARRRTALSPAERLEFVREANDASAMRMSATERAKSDADIVRPILDQYRGGDVTFAQNTQFVRSFMNAIPATERGALWTEGGGLSQEGARRVQAAIVHAAYEDAPLVSKLFESPSNEIRSIGGALLDLAPAWAKMRERARRGEIPKELDRTPDLIAAVRAVEEARRREMRPDDVFNQGGLFGSLDTARDFGQMFFRDSEMKLPASREAIAGKLRSYITEANKAQAGPNLFGKAPATAREILGATKNKVTPPEGFTLDEPGKGGPTTLRSGFDPTAPYRAYQAQAQKALDFVHNSGGYKLAPLRNLPHQPEYLAARYETLGKLAEIDKIARQIFKAFRFVSKADKRAIYEFLTTRAALPDSIKNLQARADAVEAKRMIDDVGRRLVERGMLPEEVRAEHEGSYLPRIYLKHLLGDKMVKGRSKLDLGYLKARQDIPEEVRRLILGEITDPGYLSARGYSVPMRDMVFMDFLERLSQHPDWALKDSLVTWEGRQLSSAWLWNEAQRLRKMAEHVDPLDRDHVLNIATHMESVARPALGISKVEGYKQVPDSPKYGKLRGIYIRKEIWDDLFGNMGWLVDEPSFAERILGQQGKISRLTQIWKMLHVPGNPPTVVRNIFGNFMLLQLSGVPLVRLPDTLLRAAYEMATDGEYWRIAKKYGATNTNFAHAELYHLDNFARSVLNKGGNPLARFSSLAANALTHFSNAYGMMEAWAKTAKIMDAMQREGMTAEKAALEAHKWIFDYSLIPPSVRYLRNAPFGLPFATFPYKVAPRLVETVVKNPWRLWPYLSAAMLWPALTISGLDISEDEYNALRKVLPKWMRERGHPFILPWRDDLGRFQVLDLSAFMPWNWFENVAEPVVNRGDIGSAVYQTGIGGPLGTALTVLSTNVDPFTGKEISNKADPYAKRLADELTFIWRQAAPSWLSDQGAAGKMLDVAEGRVNPKTGAPLLTPTQAGLRAVGLNVYPIDPQATRAQEIQRMSRELNDIRRRMGSAIFDRNLSPEERKSVQQTYLRRYQEKAQEIRDYARQTANAPRVR